MANRALLHQETNLVGTIVNVSVTTTAMTIYATFIDSKTGDARTPQSSTNCFVIDKDTENFEIVEAASHVTVAGVTTITLVPTYGRNLPHYGAGVGSATGLAHAIGAEIGCVDIHNTVEHVNQIIYGTNSTSGLNFRIGDATANQIKIYAETDAANKPYLLYDPTTAAWYYANDGVSENPMAGSGALNAGDGIDITAGTITVDLAATAPCLDFDVSGDIRVQIRAGYGLARHTDGIYVELDTDPALQFDAGKLEVKLKTGGGIIKDSNGLSTTPATVGITTGEAINGSVTPQAVTIIGTRVFSADFPCVDNTTHSYTAAHDSLTAFGNDDASTRYAMKITTPDIDGVITVTRVSVVMQKTLAPSGNVYIEIMDESGAKPNALIANGTSAEVTCASIATAYHMVSFTFATPPTLTKNTNYWLAFRRTAVNDAANYPQLSTSHAAAGLGMSNYTGSTATWGAVSASSGFNGCITYSVDLSGTMYRADANDTMRSNVIGFTISNVAATGTAYNQSYGTITMAGLTPGKDYFLDTNVGGISASPTIADSVALVPVGTALSATSLDIKLGVKKWVQVLSAPAAFLFRTTSGGAATDTTMSYSQECGFRPKKITANIYVTDTTANEDVSDIVEWTSAFLGQHIYRFTALDTTHRTVTAQTVISAPTTPAYCGSAQAYVNVTAINDTGFTYNVFISGTDTAHISYLIWTVEG